MTKHTLLLLLAAGVGSYSASGMASETFHGTLTINKQCDAYHSIRKQSNPSKLTIGQDYQVVARNKTAATHYRIVLPGNKQQWVSVNCGTMKGAGVVPSTNRTSLRDNDDYLLALSWQPGFCLTHASKKECKAGHSGSYSAKHLSLHGLWPQPRDNAYCGVSETDRSIDRRGRWDLLKPLVLSDRTKQALSIAMPGYASLLQRHEWIKHGTCYSETAEQYYVDSIHLTQQVNLTQVDELLAKNKGQTVSLSAIRNALATSVGSAAASRVALRCGRRNQITELWIGMAGDIQTTPIKQLMEQGKTPQSNCKSGMVSKY